MSCVTSDPLDGRLSTNDAHTCFGCSSNILHPPDPSMFYGHSGPRARRSLSAFLSMFYKKNTVTDRSVEPPLSHQHFSTSSAASRTGDVRSFNALMAKWERVFITKGTYLLMEKCLMLVYRNLVRKMWVVHHEVVSIRRWGPAYLTPSCYD